MTLHMAERNGMNKMKKQLWVRAENEEIYASAVFEIKKFKLKNLSQ